MPSTVWFKYRVDDRYIKASKLVRYLEGVFGKDGYRVSTQSDVYHIETQRKLTDRELDEIRALSARYSARSLRRRLRQSVIESSAPVPESHTVAETADQSVQKGPREKTESDTKRGGGKLFRFFGFRKR